MSSPTEKQSLSDYAPPASLSTLPPEFLTLIVNEVAHLDHLKPLNKSHHVERTNHFLHFGESSRQDIWNLATTYKQMREATMERRLRLLKKKIWTDLGKTLPENMSYIAGSVQYLDLYDPKGAFTRSFVDYQPILAAILPHFTGLHGLRIPSFLPAGALKVGHLEYLEVMFLPMSEYPVMGEKADIKPVKVDTFALTELDDAIFPGRGWFGNSGDENSVLSSGEEKSWKQNLDIALAGITSVDHLIIRTGGDCAGLRKPLQDVGRAPLGNLAGKPAFSAVKTITVELRAESEFEAQYQDQVSALITLPSCLAAIDKGCTAVDGIWNTTTSQGSSGLSNWQDCYMEDPGQYEDAYCQMDVEESNATVPPGGYEDAYTAFAKALPDVREIRIQNWVASRYIKPAHKAAFKYCFKPFQARVAKVDPSGDPDIAEQVLAATDGWKDALMAQVLAAMSPDERLYFMDQEYGMDGGMDDDLFESEGGAGMQGLLQAVLSRLASGGGPNRDDD